MLIQPQEGEKEGAEAGSKKNKGKGEREPPAPLGTEGNYSSLNCFQHSKYSNKFFLKEV